MTVGNRKLSMGIKIWYVALRDKLQVLAVVLQWGWQNISYDFCGQGHRHSWVWHVGKCIPDRRHRYIRAGELWVGTWEACNREGTGTILVWEGSRNSTTDWGAYTIWIYSLALLEGRSPRSRYLVRLVSSEASLLGSLTVVFHLCLHIAFPLFMMYPNILFWWHQS